MANPLKGEAKLGEYTLTINFGVFCALEEEMGMDTDSILELLMKGMSFSQLRTVISVALQEKHSGISLEEVGAAIDAVGGYKSAYLALGKAIKSYSGEAEEKDENPRKAA